MGLRVLFTLMVTFVGILASFFDAFYGLAAYAFWSYTYPEKITWGLIPIDRLSYVVGATLMITAIMQKKALFAKNPRVIPIIIFWILCFVAVVTAGTGFASYRFNYFTRIILVTLVITVLIPDIKKFNLYLWVIALFIGLISAQSGVIGTLKGEVGGASFGFRGIIGDRNFMAFLLCMIIPIVFYMGNNEKNVKLKLLLRFILVGDALALILTYSRGGFLGGAAAAFFIFMKSKNKILAVFAGCICLYVLVSYVMPDQYIDRIYTMKQHDIEAEEFDASAASRLILWRQALEMIKYNPLTGVGFYNSENVIGQYPDPKTGISYSGKSIHNSVLQVASETGLPAFFVFMFIFFTAYRSLGKVARKVRAYGLSQELANYALMIQVAFVGGFVSGFFMNAGLIDLLWHLVGLSIALEEITKREMLKRSTLQLSSEDETT
jgi:probable O-glycosylation ligase (exosortase A-associated)